MAGAGPHLRERAAPAGADRRRCADGRSRPQPAGPRRAGLADRRPDRTSTERSRRSAATAGGDAADHAPEYDQQPIEATSMILAAEVAYRRPASGATSRIVERAYAWFLGENDVGAVVADPATRRLLRRPRPGRRQRNQGAESTLMWLLALEHVRAIRRAVNAAPTWHAAVRRPSRRSPRAEVDHGGFREQRPVPASPVQPDPDRRPRPLPRELGVQSRRRAGRRARRSCWCGSRTCAASRSSIVARSPDGVDRLAVRSGAPARARARQPPRGDLGLRGPAPDLAPGARRVGDRLHRLQPARSAGLAGDDTRLPRGPQARSGHAARGQGRGAVPAPDRRTLGDDPPALAAARRRAHVDLVLARPPALGRPRACCSRRATAPGGTPARSAWGRRRSRRRTAGSSATTASTPRRPDRSTGSGLALLDLDDPRVVLRRTDEWVFGPAAPYERSGDVEQGRVPDRLGASIPRPTSSRCTTAPATA